MEDQYREHFKNHQDEESRKEEEGGDAVNIPKNMKMQEKTTNALNPDSVVTVLSLPSSSSETSHGATLKTFHSVSLGDNPVVFPIHLQMAEQTTPLVSKTEATPYFVLSQGPTFLSAVQDQEVLQHLNTQLHLRMAPFPTVSLQNTLCENSRMSYYQTVPDQRLTTIAEEHKIPSLLHGHRLALLLQDSLPSQDPCSSTAYQVTSPTDLFTSSLISPHPTLPHSISSVLSPLFPPVTLLVPYPFVVPLPVPLPIPIPIPIPHSGSETRAFFHPRAAGKMSKSTQTYTEEFPRPIHLHDHNFDHPVPCLSALSSLEEDVLDLSVKTNSTHTKQEVLGRVLQDTVLDLSITRVKTPSIQSCRGREPQSHQHYCKDITLSPSHKKERHPLSVEALHPVEWSVKLGCESFNDPTVLDLNRHKWVMDGGCCKSGTETKFGSRNSAVSPSQGAKDMMTVPLCEKLKDLARISMKNFSSKTDINEVTMLQQCNSTLPNSQGDWPAFSAPGSHTLKNQVVKLKKVSTQDMHVLTSKKQRLSSYSSHK